LSFFLTARRGAIDGWRKFGGKKTQSAFSFVFVPPLARPSPVRPCHLALCDWRAIVTGPGASVEPARAAAENRGQSILILDTIFGDFEQLSEEKMFG
jgi:hypothetical protein